MRKDWVRDTHERTASGEIEPVEMRSRKGTAPMSARHIRATFDTRTGALRTLEIVGERLGKSRYGFRTSNMVRRVDPAYLAEEFVPQAVRDFVEKHRPVVLRQYLVTIKLPRNPDHDPRAKRTGACIASPHCTDVTGEHHTMVIEAADDTDVSVQASMLGLHITRIERVERLVGT